MTPAIRASDSQLEGNLRLSWRDRARVAVLNLGVRDYIGDYVKAAGVVLLAMMLFGSDRIVAAPTDSIDALSGLPVVPNSFKTADPVQSYKYCGKNAQANAYMYQGRTDDEHEDLVASAKAWYLKALPHANVYTGPAGHVVFVSADGTAAVILGGFVISFVRFSPGLSATEVKGLGSAPTSRDCHAG